MDWEEEKGLYYALSGCHEFPPPPLQMTVSLDRAQSSRQEQESELRELRQNKELLTQWERQIADIIQWVTEEKDARTYLKSVAKKLADDVDTLKSNAAGTLTLGRVCSYVICRMCSNLMCHIFNLATYTP